MATSMLSVLSEESTDLDSSGGSSLPLDSSESWFADILNVDDLVEIDPNRGQFLVKLQVWYHIFFANVRSRLSKVCPKKKSRLTNCRFTTISSQISAIFHKTEVQAVILRC